MSAPLTSIQVVGLVARREFVTQVRSRSFVIGLVVTLVLAVGGGLVATLLSDQSSGSSVGLTTDTAPLRAALEQTAATQGVELEIREVDDAAGRAQLADDELDALFTGAPGGGYELVGRDTVDTSVQALVSVTVEQQTLTAALTDAGVDAAQVAARSTVAIATLEPADPDRAQQVGLALIGTVLLFISLNYAQLVATGVVEEKQSRVVELLLATIKPMQLLAGKVLGLSAVGLLQLVALGGVGAVVGAVTGAITLPGVLVGTFVMVIVWYLLGFLLFASLYAAIGSTVSRQEDLQTVIAPAVFLLIIPFIVIINVLPNDPRSELAAVLSFIPFFSQTVMPARYALGVAPLWEVGVSALVAVLAIVLVVRVAARVYRNSVLRTGARVSFREALRAQA